LVIQGSGGAGEKQQVPPTVEDDFRRKIREGVGAHCRSLGFARDDKGEGGASIWCDGSNDNLTDVVHFSFNLPEASQIDPSEAASRELQAVLAGLRW
jgi:hypothetical protein